MGGSELSRAPRRWRAGIDVGTHSVGLAAIEVDEHDAPVRILSMVSQLHDAGVLEPKTSTTRLSAAGVARRVRRMNRRRNARLTALDRQLTEWGWQEPSASSDPYAAWRARARLASEVIASDGERLQLLGLALRHMARHRGWRNPYTSHTAFYVVNEPSERFDAFRGRVEEACGVTTAPGVTIGELAVMAVERQPTQPLRMGKTEHRLRGRRKEREFSYLGGRLMQADNANEIHTYARAQGFDDAFTRQLIDLVFVAESPRGSWIHAVGRDPLEPTEPRAPKAIPTFQEFRIRAVLGNVRVRDGEHADGRTLTVAERSAAYAFLTSVKPAVEVSWSDVAKHLGLPRGALRGAASTREDGDERLPSRPPLLATDRAMWQAGSSKPLRPLRDWWTAATAAERDALVVLLVDGTADRDSAEGDSAWNAVHELDDDALVALEKLDLLAGRAGYSAKSLRRMCDHMAGSTDDLHATRRAVFGVPDDWVPPAEPIHAPVGHPAVDRVTKIVARWLLAAEREWGPPEAITLEHVRDAFKSAAAVADEDKAAQRRYRANNESRLALASGDKDGTRVRQSDVRRYEAITRQKSSCLYCGETITFHTSEMDHIVPRKGAGSTNTRSNLVAVCLPCNRSKGNTPFGVWAAHSNRPGVSVEGALERTEFWIEDPGTRRRAWDRFVAEVRERLSRTDEDPEIDARSMESVAWMANELRGRIAAHFADGATVVSVYRGSLTAGARHAAGVADKIPFIGGGGKTRLDRRHHAVDAAVVALLNPSVARTLAERESMRVADRYRNTEARDWKSHAGSSAGAVERFGVWRSHMEALASLIATAFNRDEVVVAENLRLRLGNGSVHQDSIFPLVTRRVGDAFTASEIDAASTPALWTALTRDPAFDPKHGLPAASDRRVRVQHRWLAADDEIGLFGKDGVPKPAAGLAVRGGWATNDGVHHARIFRTTKAGKTTFAMLRVFPFDLARHRSEDLFHVPPRDAWVSMRVAPRNLRGGALSTAEYLGWLVPGDELVLSSRDASDAPVGPEALVDEFGSVARWRVAGFEDSARLNLRPLQLAGEGLSAYFDHKSTSPDRQAAMRELVEKRWRVNVNALFGDYRVTVVRRDALGRPRLQSAAGLPVCWQGDQE